MDFSKRLAQAARGHGLTVLVQPLRSTDTNLVTTVAEAVDLVKAVRQPNFQLMVDYSFLTIEKEDPQVLRKARPYLRHVWIANPNGRGYPMNADEADYAALFKALRRSATGAASACTPAPTTSSPTPRRRSGSCVPGRPSWREARRGRASGPPRGRPPAASDTVHSYATYMSDGRPGGCRSVL